MKKKHEADNDPFKTVSQPRQWAMGNNKNLGEFYSSLFGHWVTIKGLPDLYEMIKKFTWYRISKAFWIFEKIGLKTTNSVTVGTTLPPKTQVPCS
ncbi:unnamed protein product [Lampetra planeri]